MLSPAAPGVLAVTGSAFRPVQQSAYMITGSAQTGSGGNGGNGMRGGGSSTDSCVKPDASSTSSNNDTTTNNEHSVGTYCISNSYEQQFSSLQFSTIFRAVEALFF